MKQRFPMCNYIIIAFTLQLRYYVLISLEIKLWYSNIRPCPLQALSQEGGGGGGAKRLSPPPPPPPPPPHARETPHTYTHSHLAKCEGTSPTFKSPAIDPPPPPPPPRQMSWLRACTHSLIHCILSLQIFMRMGLPKIITTDNGTEFKNELNKHLMDLLGIDHWLTTAYHPQVCNMSAFIFSMLQ